MPFFQMQALTAQVIMLLLLAIPVACICWTITHEEIFREGARVFASTGSRALQKGSISENSSLRWTCEVLFEPLRDRGFSAFDAMPSAIRCVARIPDCGLLSGLDCEFLHGDFRAVAAGDQEPKARNRARGTAICREDYVSIRQPARYGWAFGSISSTRVASGSKRLSCHLRLRPTRGWTFGSL